MQRLIQSGEHENLVNSNLTIVAIVGLRTTLKKDVFQTINNANDAGLQIRTFTGDSKETILALAKDIHPGKMHDEHFCMEAKEFQ